MDTTPNPAPPQPGVAKVIDYSLQPGLATGLFGNVDVVSSEGVSGWVINLAQPEASLLVNAYVGDELVATGRTGLPRDDVGKVLGRQTRCGFALQWHAGKLAAAAAALPSSSANAVVVRVQGDDRPIAGSGTATRSDLLAWSRSLASGQQPGDRSAAGGLDLTPKALSRRLDAALGGVLEPDARAQGDVKLIAYYLPQFHPIPENDEWWGPGFTEWTNVAQARTYFDGHYQPHVPGELGFYDLRLPEVREAQARLAREHGIWGFCYYYYWFEGRRLLERPLQEVFESGKPDFPFCICWTNENWSRTWDGSEHEILVHQVHNEKTDDAFIHDVIPLLKDPRYICLNGAPLLIIYRLSLMPNPGKTAKRWREVCKEHGIPELHLCMAETFGVSEPHRYGFDSAVQFPPHHLVAPRMNESIPGLKEGYTGHIYNYGDVIQNELGREPPPHKRFPGVMTSWDNTARKKSSAMVFHGSTPDLYEVWLRGAIDQARERLPQGERLVFINAWNEWAEGAHLEPDRANGRGYLEATRRALTGQSDWRLVLDYARRVECLAGSAKDGVLGDLRFALERLHRVNEHLTGVLGRHGLSRQWSHMKPGLPPWAGSLPLEENGVAMLEQLGRHRPPGKWVHVERAERLLFTGWGFAPSEDLREDTPSYLVLQGRSNEQRFYATIDRRVERPDVAASFPPVASASSRYSGFHQLVDMGMVVPGSYSVALLTRFDGGAAMTHFDAEVEVG